MNAREISLLLLNAHSDVVQALAAIEPGEISAKGRSQLTRARNILCDIGTAWDRTHDIPKEDQDDNDAWASNVASIGHGPDAYR